MAIVQQGNDVLIAFRSLAFRGFVIRDGAKNRPLRTLLQANLDENGDSYNHLWADKGRRVEFSALIPDGGDADAPVPGDKVTITDFGGASKDFEAQDGCETEHSSGGAIMHLVLEARDSMTYS